MRNIIISIGKLIRLKFHSPNGKKCYVFMSKYLVLDVQSTCQWYKNKN